MVRIRLPPADELPPEQARSPSDLEVVRYWDLAATEDTDDLTADLGRREGGSVYKPTPTVDLILRADDDFIGIAIHGDKALGFLNLLHQFVDCHGLGLHWRPSPGCASLRRCVDLGGDRGSRSGCGSSFARVAGSG